MKIKLNRRFERGVLKLNRKQSLSVKAYRSNYFLLVELIGVVINIFDIKLQQEYIFIFEQKHTVYIFCFIGLVCILRQRF